MKLQLLVTGAADAVGMGSQLFKEASDTAALSGRLQALMQLVQRRPAGNRRETGGS